jgi:uncharacterized membrane protein YciS (DUF1049 family)
MIEARRFNSVKQMTGSQLSPLSIAFGLMAGTLILFLAWLLIDDNFLRIHVNYYLLPWIGATAVVLLAPTIYLLYRKKLDIFHPLVHAAWSYWFPSFVVGGLFIATDVIEPYQMSLLSDPQSDLIWTCVYVMLGFASMTLGFYLPAGKWLGEYASRRLPAWNWKPHQVLLPALVFLGIGQFFYVSAFLSGVVGYSITDLTDVYSTLNYTLSFLSLEAGFLVAMYIFKSRYIRIEHILAFAVIIVILLSRLSLGANRSSILLIVILMAMAYFYSGRRLTPITGAVFGVLALLAVIVGMIYGTTFRNVKMSEERTDLEQQIETISRTIDTISTQDTDKVLDQGFTNLAERIDGISSVAVVVSNYERLKPYEASYGLENNIITDLWTSFIPRFLWAEKPAIFDSRAYSDLYFNFNGNSYALTPVGDLLRNFGPVGVLIGMIIAGMFLRFAYSALIENQTITIGRATAYYMFLVSLTYEGFYSSIIIYGWRIFALVFISFVFAEFLLIAKKRM